MQKATYSGQDWKGSPKMIHWGMMDSRVWDSELNCQGDILHHKSINFKFTPFILSIRVFNNATCFPSFFFQLIWPIDTNLETIHCYIIDDHWCLWHQECITMLKWGSLIASMAQISTPKIAFAWNYTIAWIALEINVEHSCPRKGNGLPLKEDNNMRYYE